jgi:hypothetical protein
MFYLQPRLRQKKTQGMFKIQGVNDLISLGEMTDVTSIHRIQIQGFEEILSNRSFHLDRFPQDHGLTLEFIDCQYPLETLLDNLHLKPYSLTTVIYRFTREYQRPVRPLTCSRELPFERLVIDFGARLDATNLRIQNLVLYNLLSVTNLDKALHIHTLTIIHSHNIVPDGEVSPTGGYTLPYPQGLTMLVIPESQEFQYEVGKTIIPDIVGIIPSSFYPSRFATGIQQAREPFSKSQLPEIVYELYSRANA